MKTIKNFKQFEDVYYPPTPIYETERERDEKLQKFAEQFADEQVGLEVVNVGVFYDGISVRNKVKRKLEDIGKRGGTLKKKEKDPKEFEKFIKDDWRGMANDMIEELDKFGYPGWELVILDINGYNLRHYGEFPKVIKDYSHYPFGG